MKKWYAVSPAPDYGQDANGDGQSSAGIWFKVDKAYTIAADLLPKVTDPIDL